MSIDRLGSSQVRGTAPLANAPAAEKPVSTSLQIGAKLAGKDKVTMTGATMVDNHTLRIGYEHAGKGGSHSVGLRWNGHFSKGTPPAIVHGRRAKIRYATQAGVAPPTFVFFTTDPSSIHFSYRRYLENRLRDAFGFAGTPIRILLRARKPSDGGPRKPRARRSLRRARASAR